MNQGQAGRREPRYRVAALVDVTGTKDILLYHRIHDVSTGGLCFEAASSEEVGNEIEVVLDFPRVQQQLPIKGEVVWVDGEESPQVGLRWIDLSAETRTKLEQFIAVSRTAETCTADSNGSAA